MEAPECTACRIRMEPGFMLDHGDANYRAVGEWVEGMPERSFWSGLKVAGRERIPVVTYRCRNCGILQSYALTD